MTVVRCVSVVVVLLFVYLVTVFTLLCMRSPCTTLSTVRPSVLKMVVPLYIRFVDFDVLVLFIHMLSLLFLLVLLGPVLSRVFVSVYGVWLYSC